MSAIVLATFVSGNLAGLAVGAIFSRRWGVARRSDPLVFAAFAAIAGVFAVIFASVPS